MKTRRTNDFKAGFTLVELMVAMAITMIIVSVLIYITSTASDTWSRSRSEVRAARQAKVMVDMIAHDLEALVTREGTYTDPSNGGVVNPEWLSAKIADPMPTGSTNAADLIFFTAATDRYDGQIGDATKDKGGDVSCVAYRLKYKDPIGMGSVTYSNYVLNRLLVNPDATFANLLRKADLKAAFDPYSADLDLPANFICENIYQFSVTFHLQVTDTTKNTVSNLPVTLGSSGATYFKINGTGVSTDYNGTLSAYVPTGKLQSMELAVTVLNDSAVEQIRKTPSKASDKAFLAKNSYQYSKRIMVPDT